MHFQGTIENELRSPMYKMSDATYTICTLKCRRQFQSLQWLMPIIQQRSILNKVKECDIWLLNRYYNEIKEAYLKLK